MKTRRVLRGSSAATSSSPTANGLHSYSNSSSSSSSSARVQCINRLLLIIGLATLTADVVFFYLTTERQQQRRREKRLQQQREEEEAIKAELFQQEHPDLRQQQQQQQRRGDDPQMSGGGGGGGGGRQKKRNKKNLRRNNNEQDEGPNRRGKQQKQRRQQPQHPRLSNNNIMDPNVLQQYRQTHAEVLAVFEEAGIALSEAELQEMPTWDDVVNKWGHHPIVLGAPLHCEAFQQKVPAVERMIGSAGMFNTGTNLVTQLLKENCKIPERVEKYGINATREAHGIRWQVPWGKHTPAHFRKLHATKQAFAAGIDKNAILPVITIRDPYEWMNSMCRNPYSAKWHHSPEQCPRLTLPDGSFNQVHVKYADDRYQDATSLAHLWNDWYREYYNIAPTAPSEAAIISPPNPYEREAQEKDGEGENEGEHENGEKGSATSASSLSSSSPEYYPWIMVRMEDLIFHAKETITQVCHCIGGVTRPDRPFVYIVDSAKCDSPGHDCSTGMAQAWIKYGGRRKRTEGDEESGWSNKDYQVAGHVLDEELMEQLRYRHPKPV